MKPHLRIYGPWSPALLSALLASACAVDVETEQAAVETGDRTIADESVEASRQALTTPFHQVAVFSNNPTPTIGVPYTPPASYNLNVADVTRTETGKYTVRLGPDAGAIPPFPAIVVAYGTDNVRCKTASTTTNPARIFVRCHLPDGTAADSRFVLNGFSLPWKGRAAGGHVSARGGVVGFNSTEDDTNIVVSKPSAGNYTISLNNLGTRAHGGTVQVGAFGDTGEHCKVVGWSTRTGTTTLDIDVGCFAPNSDTAVDTAFEFMYDEEIPTQHNRGGYSWANNSTALSYQPNTFFTFMHGPGVDTTSTSATGSLVQKLGGSEDTGHYLMVYNGLSEDVSSHAYVYVGAYGSGSDYCKISSWSLSPGGCTTNCDIGVHTLCFDKAGNRKNTKYVQTWGSFNILQPN